MQNTNERRLLQVGFAVICILVLFASLIQGNASRLPFSNDNFSLFSRSSISKEISLTVPYVSDKLMEPMSTTAQVAMRFNAIAERPAPQPIQKLLLHHDHEDVLSQIFICITFQWRVTKLTALRQVSKSRHS